MKKGDKAIYRSKRCCDKHWWFLDGREVEILDVHRSSATVRLIGEQNGLQDSWRTSFEALDLKKEFNHPCTKIFK